MEQVLLVVQVLLAIGLVGMVLLQRSDSDGFGMGSGGGSNLLSGRATANLMTRTTAIIAALFIINSLVLSVLAAHSRPASIVDAIKAEEAGAAPAVPNAADVKPDVKKDVAPAEKSVKPAVPTDGTATPVAAVKPAKKISKKVEPAPAPVPASEE